MLGMELEKQYRQRELLMMYLNTVNYGDGCYGIQAAAQNYFQTDAADLSLTQAATLAGIPQSPTFLNPKTYPDAALERRNLVLERMLSAGDITQEQCDAAQAEPLNLDPAPEVPEDGIYATRISPAMCATFLWRRTIPSDARMPACSKAG